MNEFKTYHPIVNFAYFVLVIGFSCFFMHPVCLFISLVCSFSYSLVLSGKSAAKRNLLYSFPMLILATLINPAFNHKGVTILSYLPTGNPLTLESIIYGFSAAVMIISVIFWFSCYNKIMTSDKFIYLFGKVIPSLSLVLSMTLRFIPKFTAQLKTVTAAQKCIGRDISNGGIIKRAKSGLSILSVMVTWALENSVETADSMKARGYGLPNRTAYSIFKFDKRDKITLMSILALGLYIIIGAFSDKIDFKYFPTFSFEKLSPYSLSIFIAYLALSMLPVIIEIMEVYKWKSIKSKI